MFVSYAVLCVYTIIHRNNGVKSYEFRKDKEKILCRHCGLDPQSPIKQGFEIPRQAWNDTLEAHNYAYLNDISSYLFWHEYIV